MTLNTTAIRRGSALAKHQLAERAKQGHPIEIDNPNRAQRREAKKQANQRKDSK